ncbi:hypothetical protein ACPCK9_10510 [Streptomyces koyangensis]|uniref:hypothetical protein n=1 Tax=Streptomyces koyangensis TaxID=188770 RepID=UPI003C2CA90A
MSANLPRGMSFGSGSPCFQSGQRGGREALLTEPRPTGLLDMGDAAIDGSHIKP